MPLCASMASMRRTHGGGVGYLCQGYKTRYGLFSMSALILMWAHLWKSRGSTSTFDGASYFKRSKVSFSPVIVRLPGLQRMFAVYWCQVHQHSMPQHGIHPPCYRKLHEQPVATMHTFATLFR